MRIESKTIEIEGLKFFKSIDSTKISNRISELAEQIRTDYKDDFPTYLIVLRGAFIFAADLIREIGLKAEVYFSEAKSYGNNTYSSGNVEIRLPDIDFQNRNIIIIEDIVDSGMTLKKMTEELLNKHPKSIRTATLLSKPEARKVNVVVDYIAFEIPSEFVVGWGLDFAEKGRELKHIYSKVE